MTDLFDPSPAAGTARRPVRAAAVGQAPPAWPAVPQPGYPQPLTLEAEEPCDLVGPSGSTTRVQLVEFDLPGRTISLQSPRGRKVMQIRFEQFQRLDLLRPVRPLPVPARGGVRLRPELYCLMFKSGKRCFGLTLGVEDSEAGLFLFEPTDEQASVRRVFVPRSAIAALELGEQAQARMQQPQEEIVIAQGPVEHMEVDIRCSEKQGRWVMNPVSC